jgi:hypothetical protein
MPKVTPGGARKQLSLVHYKATKPIRPSRHLLAARNYREIMRRRLTEWSKVTKFPQFNKFLALVTGSLGDNLPARDIPKLNLTKAADAR